jgi:hypothetical protein
MKTFIVILLVLALGLGSIGSTDTTDVKVVVDTVQVTVPNPRKSPEPVKDILDIFNEHAVSVLTDATTIRSAISGNQPTASLQSSQSYKPSRILCDYEVSEEGRILSEAESVELISILLDETLYEYVTYTCTFNPKYAFTFYSEADTVSVLLAARCLFVHLCDGDTHYGSGTLKPTSGEVLNRFAAGIWERDPDRGYN